MLVPPLLLLLLLSIPSLLLLMLHCWYGYRNPTHHSCALAALSHSADDDGSGDGAREDIGLGSDVGSDSVLDGRLDDAATDGACDGAQLRCANDPPGGPGRSALPNAVFNKPTRLVVNTFGSVKSQMYGADFEKLLLLLY